MNTLHDEPGGLTIQSPSLWFWMKAGFGFAIGSIVLLTIAWMVFAVFAVLGVAGLGHLFAQPLH